MTPPVLDVVYLHKYSHDFIEKHRLWPWQHYQQQYCWERNCRSKGIFNKVTKDFEGKIWKHIWILKCSSGKQVCQNQQNLDDMWQIHKAGQYSHHCLKCMWHNQVCPSDQHPCQSPFSCSVYQNPLKHPPSPPSPFSPPMSHYPQICASPPENMKPFQPPTLPDHFPTTSPSPNNQQP